LALHHDLLEQASHLALREHKKPKQASLRRSVSSAYYALFHLLVAEGAHLLSPANPAALKILIGRAFNHGQMREVCAGFVEGNAKPNSKRIPPATKAVLSLPLESELVKVLEAFVDLQEARHEADYDLAKVWTRLDAVNHVQTAHQAFIDWAKVRKTQNASVFTAALLLQKYWAR
jgi:uncharacterized protein (UPF0332 family)